MHTPAMHLLRVEDDAGAFWRRSGRRLAPTYHGMATDHDMKGMSWIRVVLNRCTEKQEASCSPCAEVSLQCEGVPCTRMLRMEGAGAFCRRSVRRP